MCATHRHLLTWALALAGLVLARPAHAWVEKTVESDVVTLDVARDGTAVVSHEIVMKLRGGPLKGFDLAGVDSDARPMPDATVSPAGSGAAASTPIPLLLDKRDDDSLRVEIDNDKGLRRGTFLFKLGYRTNLLARNLIKPAGARVHITWVGPRFEDGINSARVVFRIPRAENPPGLPAPDPEKTLLGDSNAGVFLSNLHRLADQDELEVVRPHVAKGEPVQWRIEADAKAFQAFAAPAPVPAPELQPAAPSLPPGRRALGIIVLLVVAFGYASLVVLKWRATSKACAERGAQARALLPLSAPVRGALAGIALAAAVFVAATTELPTVAGLLLLLAMGLAAHVAPRAQQPLRGPGRWLPLGESEAFARKKQRLPGRFFDSGTLPGFLVFLLSLAGFAAGGLYLLPHSPYHALMLALASACLLPIFCTGRAGELPADPAEKPRALLSWLAGKLRRHQTLKVVPWARVPDNSSEPDEMRLLVMPRRARRGLTAIEVGMEYEQGAGGPIALPCVIVRAVDGSESYHALPRSVVWTRGRKPEERVAVIRPKLPTRSMCLSLLERVVGMLEEPGAAPRGRRQSSRSRRRSSGRASSTAKAGTAASPAHAT